MLALLLFLNCALAKDTQKDYPIIKHVNSCPDVGYYFKREISINVVTSGQCHLCFCQDNGTAMCWPRQNRKCDEKYYYHGRKRRDSGIRIRRSPAGLSDIFFRDATREAFNIYAPQQCKPFESSRSEGCPPADWCIGCTVCDCDANGRWDCHILSFCPNDKGKKPPDPRLLRYGFSQTTKVKRQSTPTKKPSSTKKVTTKVNLKKTTLKVKRSTPKPPKKMIHKTVKPKIIRGRSSKDTHNKKVIKQNQIQNTKPKQSKPKKINKSNIKYNKNEKKYKQSQNKNKKKSPPKKYIAKKPQKKYLNTKPTSKTTKKKITKKNITKKPVLTPKNKRDVLNSQDSTIKFAQTIMKQVMASVEKMINDTQNNLKKTSKTKNVQKRTMPKYYSGKISDKTKNTLMSINQWERDNKEKLKQKITAQQLRKYIKDKNRRKRETASESTSDDSTVNISTNTTTTSFAIAKVSGVTTQFNSIINATSSINEIGNINLVTVVIPSEKSKQSTNYYMYNTSNNHNSTVKNYINKIKNVSMEKESSTVVMRDSPKLIIANDIYTRPREKNILLIKNDTKDIKTNVSFPFVESKAISKSLFFKLPTNKSYNNVVNSKIVEDFSKDFSKNYNCGKLCEIKSFFKHFLSNVDKKNTTNRSSQEKNIGIYFKNFLNTIFNNHKKRRLNPDKQRFSKQSVIDTLCLRVGPCTFNSSNKTLNRKVNELRSETYKVLKSVKIIKGLLKLLKLNTTLHTKTNVTAEISENHNLEQLKFILKDDHACKSGYLNLTETQCILIEYIKKNIQVFIEAIEKFTRILNEVIIILTNNNNNKHKHILTTPRFRKLKEKKPKTNKHEILSAKLEMMKNLLISYNLVQNRFMKKMYDVILNLEPKYTTTSSYLSPKVSYKNAISNTSALEIYTNNIIENLRKLENLRRKLSFKSRKKRSYRDDNAMSYLITLMEYLLKQRTPLYASPANDGIDILIEAIENAPDIKLNDNKRLHFSPIENIRKSEEKSYDISDNKQLENTQQEEKKAGVRFKPIEENNNGELFNPFNINFEKELNIPTKTDNETDEINNNIIEQTTKMSKDRVTKRRFDKFEEVILEHNNYDNHKNEGKRFDVFSDDSDEYEVFTSTTIKNSRWKIESDTTTVENEFSELYLLSNVTEEKNDVNSNKKIPTTSNKIKQDWIEENFKHEFQFPSTTTSASTSQVNAVTRTARRFKDKYSEPYNSESAEVEYDRLKVSSPNIDKMPYKQSGMLTSIDYYGTEKTEIDLDSKEDKYGLDSFSSYFV